VGQVRFRIEEERRGINPFTYGETQVPPFCVQLDISASTVSATPEKYQTVVLTETPADVVVFLQPPSAPSREQAFEMTPPLFEHSFSAVVML